MPLPRDCSDSRVFIVNLQAPTTPTIAALDVTTHCGEQPREITRYGWQPGERDMCVLVGVS